MSFLEIRHKVGLCTNFIVTILSLLCSCLLAIEPVACVFNPLNLLSVAAAAMVALAILLYSLAPTPGAKPPACRGEGESGSTESSSGKELGAYIAKMQPTA